MTPDQRKAAVAWLSVGSNTVLVLGKLVVGLFIGSVSVISEAIHSAVDLVAAIIALFAVKTAGKPADEGHPYGHGKIENISGTVEALLIFGAAAWIIIEAVEKLRHPQHMEDLSWGIAVMAISCVANFIVSEMLFRVGRETDSVALQADGWHLRTDVWTSFGVMAGLVVMVVGHKLFPETDLAWVDPVAAIGVALLIIKAAWDLTIHAAKDLLDASLPTAEEDWIKTFLQSQGGTIRGFHRLRTRKSGSFRFIDFHMLVDAQMTVQTSHDISRQVSAGIRDHFPLANVTIHVDPCDGACSADCQEGCFLPPDHRPIPKP